MKKLVFLTALVAAFPVSADNGDRIRAKLSGIEEVPAVLTAASGEFEGRIGSDGGLIDYELTYNGLQGTVTMSHIHIGQRNVNGGVVIWLCQTATNPAPAVVAPLTPVCPLSGTVSGQITSANVLPAATQQILAGEIADAIAAMRAGVAYVNVHSSLSPGGEVRGQIRANKRGD